MSANPETKRKYNDIRKEYHEVWQKKTYKGVLMYSQKYIEQKTSRKILSKA